MSYTVATPGGKTRPGTVTAASALLLVVAAVELVSLALSVIHLGPMLSAVNDVYKDQPGADAVRTATLAGAIGGAVLAALFAIGTVALSLLVRRGKNPARIVTWVLGGIGVLCNGCSLGSAALTSSLQGSTTTPEAEQLQRRLTELVPSWQSAITTAAAVVVMVALLAAVILLALPASNDFFRKEQEVWVPPTTPGGAGGGFPPAPRPPAGPLSDPPAASSVPPSQG